MDIKQLLEQWKVSKRTMRWLIGILITGIGIAFIIGVKKATYVNEFNELKKSNKENKELIIDLKNEFNNRFDSLERKVDFKFKESDQKEIENITNLQNTINDQFQFIIDHREEDKKLLKDALMMSQKNLNDNITRNIENNIDAVQNDKDKQLNQDNANPGIIKKDNFVKVTGISEKEFETLKKNYTILKSEKKGDKYDVIYLKK